jgi:hypothetical protein
MTTSATNWCRTGSTSQQVTALPGGRRVFLPLLLRH